MPFGEVEINSEPLRNYLKINLRGLTHKVHSDVLKNPWKEQSLRECTCSWVD
jgi:hypothetical protein